MPPQSRGARIPLGSHSQSTPNLPTLKSLAPLDTSIGTSPGASHGTTTAYERFPELDDDQYVSSNVDEESESSSSAAAAPQIRSRRTLFPPGAHDGESEEEDSSEEEDEDESSQASSSSSSSERHNTPLNARFLQEDSDEDEDEDASDDDDDDDGGAHSSSSSQPSTLRPPASASLPSSTTASPQKRPTPNRTQSLYTQPLSLTKSHPSKLPGTATTFTSPTRNHSSHHIPAAFAPPFYNRPPTPLPPSPSLTSLLRPPFSALPSRPATPGTRTPVDSSSDTDATHPTLPTVSAPGTASGTGPSAAASTTSLNLTAANAPIQPPSAPKIPTYEYYGFVLYITSSFCFFLYLLWSYLPMPFLHGLGIYYYPNRWWSLAVPAWLIVALLWVYVALGAYNTDTLTGKLGDIGWLVDEKGTVAVVGGSWGRGRRKGGRRVVVGKKRERSRGKKGRGRKERKRKEADGVARLGSEDLDWGEIWNEGTDAVLDIPIGGVCEILYGTGREREEEWDENEVDDVMSGEWTKREDLIDAG